MTDSSSQTAGQPRILLILDHFYPYVGGAETLFWQQSRELVKRGIQVTVITLWQPNTSSIEIVDGVEIYRVKPPFGVRRLLFGVWVVPRAIIEARKAELLHTSVCAAAIAARLAAAVYRKPALLTVYEVFGDQWQRLSDMKRPIRRLFRFFEWLVLRLRFTHYVCISQHTRIRLLRFTRIAAAKTTVVYPPLDYEFWDKSKWTRRELHRELQLEHGSLVFLYFGRPGVSKGVDFLIQAAAKVRPHLPTSRFLLLLAHDPANGYERVMRHIQELDLTQYVIVRDPVPRDDLPSYLLGSDCVVVPSISEGFGYAAVEAATLGCRVVTTSGHAVEEVLNGHASFVVPGNATALAEALVQVAKQKGPARVVPRRYTLQLHIDKMLEVYDRMLGAES